MPMKAGVHQKGIWSDVVFFRLANTAPLFANMHQAKLILFSLLDRCERGAGEPPAPEVAALH